MSAEARYERIGEFTLEGRVFAVSLKRAVAQTGTAYFKVRIEHAGVASHGAAFLRGGRLEGNVRIDHPAGVLQLRAAMPDGIAVLPALDAIAAGSAYLEEVPEARPRESAGRREDPFAYVFEEAFGRRGGTATGTPGTTAEGFTLTRLLAAQSIRTRADASRVRKAFALLMRVENLAAGHEHVAGLLAEVNDAIDRREAHLKPEQTLEA